MVMSLWPRFLAHPLYGCIKISGRLLLCFNTLFSYSFTLCLSLLGILFLNIAMSAIKRHCSHWAAFFHV